MREKICGIYKITNKIDGKVYIGKSINIYYRWTQHIKIAKNPSKYRDGNRPLYHAMSKYGIDNFEFEIVDICVEEMLCEREIYWIDIYDCTTLSGHGYNLTPGGENGNFSQAKKAYQYDLNGNFVAEYNTIRDAAVAICNKPDASAIQNAMGKIGSQSYGYQWRYDKYDKIEPYVKHRNNVFRVAKYDEDGNLVATYRSVKEAADSIGKSKSIVRLSCLNKVRCAGGFTFRYYDDKPEQTNCMRHKDNPGRDGRAIKQMDGDIVLRIFDSAKDVAEYLKVTDRSALYKCCNHKLKTHFGYCLYKGYRWEWA